MRGRIGRKWIERWEPVLVSILLFFLLDWWVHRFPETRVAYDFRPEAAGGDINEFFTIWVARFSAVLRSLPFTQTFYLVNPWGHFTGAEGGSSIPIFYSHPPLLSFLSALLQGVAGDGPVPLRRLAIFLFCLRLSAFWLLARAAGGTAVGRLSALLHLASPGTQLVTHSLLCEPSALGLALLAFWAVYKTRCVWAFLAVLALLADWTASFWLVFLIFPLWKERRLAEIAALGSLLLFLPLTYNSLLVGVFEEGHFKISSFPIFSRSPGEVSGLMATGVRLREYLGVFYNLQAFSAEDRMMVARRFYQALPLFVLLPAVLGMIRLRGGGFRSFPSWVAASLVGGALFFLAFSGGFIVHTYMFLPFSFGLCYLAAEGWIWLWGRLCCGRALAKVLLASFTLLAVSEAVLSARLSFVNERSAGEIGQFHEEGKFLSNLIPKKTAYVVKDRSQWEPNPLLVDAGQVYFLPEPRYRQRGEEKCVQYNVIFSDVFQKEYGHAPLYEQVRAHLAAVPECSQNLWEGKYLRLVPGACMCGFRM
jgi:hypothetical protein